MVICGFLPAVTAEFTAWLFDQTDRATYCAITATKDFQGGVWCWFCTLDPYVWDDHDTFKMNFETDDRFLA